MAGYRIDLAVCLPGSSRGATCWALSATAPPYHRAKSVRDRTGSGRRSSKSLGWTIYRVWSTDWFRDPDGELRRLLREIDRLKREVAERRIPRGASGRSRNPGHQQAGEAGEPDDAPAAPTVSPETAGEAPEPSADGHLPPEASLEERLAHYRETRIMRDLPGSEPGRCILRERMIDVMIAEWLDDPDDFTAKVPRGTGGDGWTPDALSAGHQRDDR